MKKNLPMIFGFVLLAGFVVQGIFGAVISVLLCGIAVAAVGFYRKERAVWKPALIVVSADVALIVLFFALLINSGM